MNELATEMVLKWQISQIPIVRLGKEADNRYLKPVLIFSKTENIDVKIFNNRNPLTDT